MTDQNSKKPNDEDQTQPDGPASTLTMPKGPDQHVKIGPFQILELLGAGGMGEVYLAEQKTPIKRRVALKLIKVGMDTKEVVARFESERQALAMMNHPNVARIFDAGSTDAGRPYFVMEYVPGVPITDYCDRHRLDLRSRLELFIPVCQAIHHAHQKGIIHRDIKPSNVLVAMENGKPVPKVIDFGVAKATQQTLTDKTLHTMQGRLIGTPAYMSPEQAEMTGLNVDTTSDVYSLGVLLYELLVGALPFDSKQLVEAGIAEIHRIIREVEPPKPSTKISSLGDMANDLAAKRHIGSSRWHKQLSGELDWITMRAMDKDRARRYQSAWALAEDVECYLHNKPVQAHRPSTTYQLKKLIARHKVRFGFLVSLGVVLVISSVGMSIQARKISLERDRANEEAETAKQVSDFLVDLFNVSDPSERKVNTITAREILDEGRKKIEGELLDQPLVRARLMDVLGNVYYNLALYDTAKPLLEGALKVKQDLLGSEDLGVARSLNSFANLLWAIGDNEGARPLHERSLAIFEKRLGPDHPDVASSLNSLGLILYAIGDYEGARPLFERALAILEKSLGPDHPIVASSLSSLGNLLWSIGDIEGARPLFERSLAIREKRLGPDHPDVANSLHNLANLLYVIGDYEGARPLYERSLAIKEKSFGPDHPSVAIGLANLANLVSEIGDNEGARPLYERSLAIFEKRLGPDHPDVARSLGNLALLLTDIGDYEGARLLYERSLAIEEKRLDHSGALRAIYNMACLASLEKNRDMAIGYLAQLLERGYTDNKMWIAEDSDFNFLHGDSEFEAIIAEIRKRNSEK